MPSSGNCSPGHHLAIRPHNVFGVRHLRFFGLFLVALTPRPADAHVPPELASRHLGLEL